MKKKIFNRKVTKKDLETIGVLAVKGIVGFSVGVAIDALLTQNISYSNMNKFKSLSAGLGIWIASAVIADEITDKFIEQFSKKVEDEEEKVENEPESG